MLLEHLKELIDYGFVEKRIFTGYPLHVEYFLTPVMGQEILEALKIMQRIGIDYLGLQRILPDWSLRIMKVRLPVILFRE